MGDLCKPDISHFHFYWELDVALLDPIGSLHDYIFKSNDSLEVILVKHYDNKLKLFHAHLLLNESEILERKKNISEREIILTVLTYLQMGAFTLHIVYMYSESEQYC